MASTRAVVLLAASCAVVPAISQASTWRVLGEQYVDFRTNSVSVDATAGKARFRDVRLQVRDHPLEIDDVTVVLAGGRSFEVPLDSWVGADRSTRTIRLPDGPAAIRKVEFTYRNGSSSEATLPLVRVTGKG